MARSSAMGLLVLITAASSAPADDSLETFFEVKIRPVLATECLSCHGGKKTSGGLSVAAREGLLAGGDRGPAIVVGDPDRSLLIQAIRQSHDEVKMPPKKRLSDENVADLARWIAQGAPWPSSRTGQGRADAVTTAPRHWAFERVKAPAPPPDPTGWSGGPIDRFIAAQPRSGRPATRASRRPAHARPPRHVRPDRTAADARGGRRVPRRSPPRRLRHGRRPPARLAALRRALGPALDGRRPLRRHRRRQRRLSRSRRPPATATTSSTRSTRDKPYDQFVREQLAGDILARDGAGARSTPSRSSPPASWPSRAATRPAPYELWHLTLEDTIETTGRAFLGLTLRCARCHDHKFDPVTQRDYYALYGIFASTTFPYAGSEEFQSKEFPRMNFVPLVRAGARRARS